MWNKKTVTKMDRYVTNSKCQPDHKASLSTTYIPYNNSLWLQLFSSEDCNSADDKWKEVACSKLHDMSREKKRKYSDPGNTSG